MAKELESLKMEPKQDRISNLPDCLIQHILTFLPSTKEAIRTSVLSKQWKKQWTRVPVLILGPSVSWDKSFLKFLENTIVLHDCTKIKKFHLTYPAFLKKDNFDETIRFATSKHVEDLTLNLWWIEKCILPEFVFNYAFLVKLEINKCTLVPEGKVEWRHLKSLILQQCGLSNQALAKILSGSPLLELFELHGCDEVDELVLTCEFLKRLVLKVLKIRVSEISCPNLKELSILIREKTVFKQAIQNIMSSSLLLESLELILIPLEVRKQVIASKSLRRLVIRIYDSDDLLISCPKLEELELQGSLNFTNVEFTNFPSSVCATLRFSSYMEQLTKKMRENSKDLMWQLQHVKELQLWYWNIGIFVGLEARLLFSQMLCVKSLIIHIPNWKDHQSGIACVLRNSPLLESLVIRSFYAIPKMDNIGENYWSLDENVLGCSVSHLKTVTFQRLPYRPRIMLNFAQFLLKNARVLEKMVVLVDKNQSEYIPLENLEELFSYQRCLEHAIVEMLTENVKVD